MNIVIVVKEVSNGRYEARLGKDVVCVSKTPMFSAARELVRLGFDENDTLKMTRDGERVDMVMKLGKAAQLTVEEGQRRGPTIAAYREMPVGVLEKD